MNSSGENDVGCVLAVPIRHVLLRHGRVAAHILLPFFAIFSKKAHFEK